MNILQIFDEINSDNENDNIEKTDTYIERNEFILPKYSIEQQTVLKSLNENNVIVDSVAGSGKTTTILHIGKEYENDDILLLTYNSKLKLETREKCVLYNIPNIETHSYHSFNVKYYYDKDYTDDGIIVTTRKNIAIKDVFEGKKYTKVIIDEAQDITPLYYKLICKIFKDFCNKNTKICILGDQYQSIYGFNNADSRFIRFADKVFHLNNFQWIWCKLSTSFRITNTICDFLNNCMLQSERLRVNKINDFKPQYIICDTFGNKFGLNRKRSSIIFKIIKDMIENNEYKPCDFFILAPSIKSQKSPVRILENTLKTKMPCIPIFVPTNDEEKIDSSVIENKMVFSTFHQSKGLERKVVFVFNFDDSYFHMFNNNTNRMVCPNEIYVACTRAKERLFLIHHYENDYLGFLNTLKLKTYCNVIINEMLNVKKNKFVKNINTPVTRLIANMKNETIQKCMEFLDIRECDYEDSSCSSESSDCISESEYSSNCSSKSNSDKNILQNNNDNDNDNNDILERNDNDNDNTIERNNLDLLLINNKYNLIDREKNDIIEKNNIMEKNDNIERNIELKNNSELIKIKDNSNDKYDNEFYESKYKDLIDKYENINDDGLPITIPLKTKQKYGYENVSEITGEAIPIYFDYVLNNSIGILDELKNDDIRIDTRKRNHSSSMLNVISNSIDIRNFTIKNDNLERNGDKNGDKNENEYKILIDNNENKNNNKNQFQKYEIERKIKNNEEVTIPEILYIANIWCCYKSGYIFKSSQIINYNWIKKITMDKCISRLFDLQINHNAKFEFYVESENNPELLNRKLIGYIDCICEEDIYEFKAVEKLKQDHFIQLGLYMYLFENYKLQNNIQKQHNYYLFNILNNELYEIEMNLDNLKNMVYYLIYQKYVYTNSINDEKFLKNCFTQKNNIFNM